MFVAQAISRLVQLSVVRSLLIRVVNLSLISTDGENDVELST